MKILLLDIETKPLTVYTWGLWKQNINIGNIIDSSGLLCFAAKWVGDETVHFYSVKKHGLKRMLKAAHKLLSEADAVCHYNGQKFDIPVLNKEFLLQGMDPPATYQQIDLLKTARQRFKFPSNKLDFLAQQLGLGKKFKHAGFELWVKCMAGDPEAWKEMEQYNIQDVVLLERVYNKLLPWIVNHPSHAVHNEIDGCTNCGSPDLIKRGFSYTATSKYQRYQCNNCGSWMRSKTAEKQTVKITKDKNG
jgi:DNA polymerase elongation subunit (family B)